MNDPVTDSYMAQGSESLAHTLSILSSGLHNVQTASVGDVLFWLVFFGVPAVALWLFVRWLNKPKKGTV